MKKSVLFLLFLLVLPFAYSSDWIYNSENIIVDLEMGGKIDVVPKTSKYSLQYVITNLSFVPQDGFQEEILSLETNPSADVRDRTIIYRWDDPTGTELEYGLKSSIRSFNKFVKVKKKISFPLDDILDDIKVYTKPSETIDSDNEAIIKKASEIIEGEDDLYVVVFKLGEWTKNNVKYDLSTLTAKATQKASWVLGTKEGVCDELTNLFIAMNRALGIPAKFISGMAYTNAEEFEEGFGTHGWAEVYFPDYGWVPFDVTYGEFGFVDASHIKLKESVDANDASTKYQWLGKDISLKTNPLDIKAELKDTSGEIDELIDISAKAVKGEVGFGSYNLVEASVENLNNHYVATTLFLSKTREVELIDKEEKYLLLKPNEERKVSWIIKVSGNLEQGYMYTFPFVVRSIRNVSSKIMFEVIEDSKRFSLEGIEDLVDDEDEKVYAGDVEISCKANKKEIYEDETSLVECDVKNIGNIYLEDLNVCLDKDCKKMGLGITQKEEVSFEFKPKEVGVQEVVIKASNKEVSKSTFVDVTVYDKPVIEISEMEYPEEVMYKNVYEVSFVLNKKSRFAPNDVKIIIEPINKEFELEELKESRRFILNMQGSELDSGDNWFKISISYKDKKDKSYETAKEFNIRLVNVSMVQHVRIFVRNIAESIVRVFR